MDRLLSRRGRLVRYLLPAVVLLIVGGALPIAGAHATSAHRSAFKVGGTVVIDNVGGSLWTCGFNPYGATTAGLAAGILYEPLWYVNQLTNAQRPWLATTYAWSNGNKTLTFSIRQNVNWSDGKPLTAADVAFTFNLMKKFSGLDLQAVWTVLSSVRAQGNKVIFSFKQASVPFFFYIADQNYILPQHIWASIKDPVTYTDPHPVGSGPFLLKSCSPQDITYTRNPHYWQAGKPYISEVRYPAFQDNQPGNLFLRQGQANWGGQFIPNIKSYYLDAGPNRHNWNPPAGADVNLYLNLTKYPLNILAVRQAISFALDRSTISRLGVYGYLPPANQTGIILPTWQSWYDSSLAAKYNYGYQPAKAISLLQHAGFKRGSNGTFQDKKGRPLSLQILDNQGYTDWLAENQIIRQDLKAIGIDVTDLNISGNDQISRLGTGNFEAAYYSPTGGPLPYYQYRQLLHSANSAPIGKVASSNYERFHSKIVDGLLDQYSKTTDSSLQHTIINKIQQVMLAQVPIVPVLENVNWFQYDTSKIVGWPTPQNPYASPAPYNTPDWEVVLTTVHQK